MRDLVAGVTLAATDIPQVLGYTKIAGTPVVTGLYTLLLPLVAFAAFGSSRYLVVAADSASAAILAGGVGEMALPGEARYAALAGMVALMTAGFLLLVRVLRLGFIADFLSRTVLMGFLTGVGFQVGIGVLGGMLGVAVRSHRPVMQLVEVARGLPRASLPTIAVSVAVLGVVLGLRRVAPRFPASLLVVMGAIAASAMLDFAGHGVATIGPVMGGLPHLTLPRVEWREMVALAGVSASCAVMILTQSAATARVYGARHHEDIYENDELLGLAAANAVAAVSGTFVVNGSPTQTAMAQGAGASSQLAQMTTAAVVAVVLAFFTGPLKFLPQCVLSALVFLVAMSLIDLRGLAGIRLESTQEFALAVATAVVVVGIGVEQGIVLAMIVSLLRVVHHSYHPDSGVLVPDGQGSWVVTPVGAGVVTEPGLVVYRFGASLFYANAGRFMQEMTCLVGRMPSAVRWIVVDAEAMTNVDYSAARVVMELKKNLTDAGVELAFARVSWSLQADFDRHHLTEVIGATRIFHRLHDAMKMFAWLPKE